MQKSVVLLQNHIELLSDHAKRNIPNESCAILFGKTENENIIVKDVFLTKNIENSPVNFTISNDELITAYGEAEKRNLEVIGIFHSHPDSNAYPSSTDKKFMEINPVPWVIFSNKNKEFKAYIFESEIMQVSLEIK
ncbi:MAG TPA: M67 family metallopeptidase [Nitrosopumilaceae archaeon]|nr:M67 family metallopeptidase [Nitrosopumilaceae archaeon]